MYPNSNTQEIAFLECIRIRMFRKTAFFDFVRVLIFEISDHSKPFEYSKKFESITIVNKQFDRQWLDVSKTSMQVRRNDQLSKKMDNVDFQEQEAQRISWAFCRNKFWVNKENLDLS